MSEQTMRWSARHGMAALVALAMFAGGPVVRAAGVNDDANLFGDAAIKTADATIQELQEHYNVPVTVEVYKEIPADQKGQYSPDKKDEFFNTWTAQRFAASGSQGVFVLICRDPATIKVVSGGQAATAMGGDHSGELREILRRNFHAKKYDEGLTEMLRKTELALRAGPGAAAGQPGNEPNNLTPGGAPAMGQPNGTGNDQTPGVAVPGQPAAPGAPDTVADSMGLFSPDAKYAAGAVIDRVKQHNDADLMVETFAEMPQVLAAQYNPQTRLRVLSAWAVSRYQTNGVHGVYIMVCKGTGDVTVRSGDEAAAKMGSVRDTDIATTIGNDIRAGKNDQGLLDAVRLVEWALDNGNNPNAPPPPVPLNRQAMGQPTGQQAGQQTWAPGPDPWGPVSSSGVIDYGQFFSRQAQNSGDTTVGQIQQRSGRDVLVETRNDIPPSMMGQYNPQAGRQFMYQWAVQRYQLNHTRGVYVLICRQARLGEVLVGQDTQAVLGKDNAQHIAHLMGGYFKAGQFDQGLAALMQNLSAKLIGGPKGGTDLDAQPVEMVADEDKDVAENGQAAPAGEPVAGGAQEQPTMTTGVDDMGGFFNVITRTGADAMIKHIASHTPVLVETYAEVPAELTAQAQQEGKAFVANWARQRAAAVGGEGIYVLVCKNPRQLAVQLGSKAITALHGDKTSELRETLVSKFKENDYDQGLLEMLKDVEADIRAPQTQLKTK